MTRTHQAKGQEQHRFAANPVAIIADNDSANRPGDEADREGAESEQRAGERIRAGKEQLSEHQTSDTPE